MWQKKHSFYLGQKIFIASPAENDAVHSDCCTKLCVLIKTLESSMEFNISELLGHRFCTTVYLDQFRDAQLSSHRPYAVIYNCQDIAKLVRLHTVPHVCTQIRTS